MLGLLPRLYLLPERQAIGHHELHDDQRGSLYGRELLGFREGVDQGVPMSQVPFQNRLWTDSGLDHLSPQVGSRQEDLLLRVLNLGRQQVAVLCRSRLCLHYSSSPDG